MSCDAGAEGGSRGGQAQGSGGVCLGCSPSPLHVQRYFVSRLGSAMVGVFTPGKFTPPQPASPIPCQGQSGQRIVCSGERARDKDRGAGGQPAGVGPWRPVRQAEYRPWDVYVPGPEPVNVSPYMVRRTCRCAPGKDLEDILACPVVPV